MSWIPKNSVVVPVDFSEPSLEAMSLAKELVLKPAGLHLVHVVELLPGGDANAFTEDMNYPKSKDDALQQLKRIMTEQGLSDCQPVVLDNYHQRGSGLTLAKYAKDIGAELIVISTHGYTGLRRLLMGSVAEQVLRHAECPVLVLPPRHQSA